MLLARAGYEVLLLDRVKFPRDTLSTHYIHQPGVDRLEEWGLLDAVKDSGCPPITHAVSVVEGERIQGWAAPTGTGPNVAYAPRRYVLDTILAEAAVRSGADFRDGCSVAELLVTDDRVTGVRYQASGGAATVAPARVVIGADGMSSTVARLVNATKYSVHPRITCAYYTYWEDVPAGFEFYHSPQGAVGAIPTHEKLTMVATYFPQSEFARVRADPMAGYLDALHAVPELYEHVKGRQPVERLRGTGNQLNFFRTATGPGWALVGDAGHHQDSVSARGITNAFVQADLLARCLLDNGADLDAGLRRFASERDDMLRPSYEGTLTQAGNLIMPPGSAEFARIVRNSPELTTLFFGTIAGVTTLEEFFSHEGLASLGTTAAQ
jgi:flavin-dependent dehydrogenase